MAQGGNIYGGYYNYLNLQYIFAPYYQTQVYNSAATDTMKVIDPTLSTALGYSVIAYPQNTLTLFDLWGDIPTSNVTVYGVIMNNPATSGSSQGIPIIVENRVGSGKYVWTSYHNQNILSDPTHRLVRIDRYFLYCM